MVEMDHIQSGREVRRGDPVIEVRDVWVFYGQAPALKDVSLFQAASFNDLIPRILHDASILVLLLREP